MDNKITFLALRLESQITAVICKVGSSLHSWNNAATRDEDWTLNGFEN